MVAITSFPPPTEGIVIEESNTHAHVGSKQLGKGTLYIAESRVSWRGDNGHGFSIEYPSIALHAVSRDLTAYPQECLYLMIDAKIEDDKENGSEENEEDETNDDDPVSEIRFIPNDKDILDVMFRAMSDCQTLHPDPTDSISEDEGDDLDTSNGRMDAEQFEDAEM